MGVILNLAVWIALHVIFAEHRSVSLGPIHLELPVRSSPDIGAAILLAPALVAVLKLKLGMVTMLAGAAAAVFCFAWQGSRQRPPGSRTLRSGRFRLVSWARRP